jgi:hypothetical protein
LRSLAQERRPFSLKIGPLQAIFPKMRAQTMCNDLPDLDRTDRAILAVLAAYRHVLAERISTLPHVAATSTYVAMEAVKDRRG